MSLTTFSDKRCCLLSLALWTHQSPASSARYPGSLLLLPSDLVQSSFQLHHSCSSWQYPQLLPLCLFTAGLPRWLSGKESTCQCQVMQEMPLLSLGQEDPLEKRMATHSSVLASEVPWTEEPGGLQSLGLQRLRCNWSDLAHMHRCCGGPPLPTGSPPPPPIGSAPILSIFEESTPIASKHVHGLSTLNSPLQPEVLEELCLCADSLPSLPTLPSNHRSPTAADLHQLTGNLHWLNPAGFSVLVIFQRHSAALTTPAFLKPCPLGPSSDNPSASPSTFQLFVLSLLPQFILLYPAIKCWRFSKLRPSSLWPLSVEE